MELPVPSANGRYAAVTEFDTPIITHSSAYLGAVQDCVMAIEWFQEHAKAPSEVVQKCPEKRRNISKILRDCVKRTTPQTGVSLCSYRTSQTLRTQWFLRLRFPRALPRFGVCWPPVRGLWKSPSPRARLVFARYQRLTIPDRRSYDESMDIELKLKCENSFWDPALHACLLACLLAVLHACLLASACLLACWLPCLLAFFLLV